MSYNNTHVEPHLKTAGKITILTTLFGVVGFLFVFLLNVGQSEFQVAQAQQNATTSVNVLNTPPTFNSGEEPIEETESSVTLPTNSGDEIAFIATATDQNGAPYFLLVCNTGTAPVPQANAGTPGTAPPLCGDPGALVAVSTSTISNTQARAATTTQESDPESINWFAWACDDDSVNPECTPSSFSGSGTGTSPYIVNHRPSFGGISNNGPVDPGDTLIHTSVSSDTDTSGTADTVQLIVCSSAGFDTVTDTCTGGTLATSSFVSGNATTSLVITVPTQDNTYDAFVYMVDNHGHEATGGSFGTNDAYTVSNVAPTIDGSQISLNDGNNLIIDTPAGETTGFTLSFVANDANSCENSAAGAEITDYIASVYRSGIGSSTCDVTAANYNPNNCYPSEVGAATWNISCSATTTGAGACGGSGDATELWECTFPLWYVADPTDAAAVTPVFEADDWRAAVAAVDDNSATSTLFEQSTAAGIEVQSALFFSLDTAEIPYGSLAPGDNVAGSTTINTTVRPTGNVGIDTNLSGLHMCPDGVTVGTCTNIGSSTATSSIPEYQQEYSATTSGFVYGSGTDLTSAPVEFELNVPKATATSSQPTGITYWGIEIPATISFAGLYTGRNTIQAVTSESVEW